MRKERFYDLYTRDDLQAMYSVMTQEELSKKTGFCTKQLYRYLKKWGIEKRARGRSCPWPIFNEDTEFINYLGGFLYADGSLHKTSHTGYTLSLILHPKDERIIDVFLSELNGGRKYRRVNKKTGQKTVGLYIYGIDLPDKLLKFGVTPDKRYGWTRPQITDSMLPHFLRGWYDGDGHISGKSAKMTLTNINEEAIRYFEEMIHYLGYSGSGFKGDHRRGSGYSRIYVTKNNTIGKLGKNRDPWRHTITGKANCLKIYDLLKADSPLRLDRKWGLIEKYM